MEIQTGMSKNYPGFANSLTRVKPRDIDQEIQYCVLKPAVGTAALCSTTGTATAGTVLISEPDYPRSLLVGWADASGTAYVGTVIVDGEDQFGVTISETFANTDGGTTDIQGTKVFAYVGTITPTGAGGAAGDSLTVGYGIGAGTARIGLPNKVSGSADVKRVTWIDAGATKLGTVTIDKVNHAFLPSAAVDAGDDYIVTLRPNYTTDDDHQCTIDNSALVTNA